MYIALYVDSTTKETYARRKRVLASSSPTNAQDDGRVSRVYRFARHIRSLCRETICVTVRWKPAVYYEMKHRVVTDGARVRARDDDEQDDGDGGEVDGATSLLVTLSDTDSDGTDTDAHMHVTRLPATQRSAASTHTQHAAQHHHNVDIN